MSIRKASVRTAMTCGAVLVMVAPSAAGAPALALTALRAIPARPSVASVPGTHAMRPIQVPAALRAAPHQPGDLFGEAVAISGGTAVVGAPGVSNGAGAAYIFARVNGAWRQQARLPDPAHTGPDNFGSAVAVSGATVLIGADGVRNDAGAAYVYVRSNGAWHRQATLTDPADSQPFFGVAVAIDVQTAVVGAQGAPKGGAVFIYVRSKAAWRQQARLPDPLRAGVRLGFGYSLALWNGTIVAAADKISGAGVVFIYGRNAGRWHRQARLADPGASTSDFFGTALAVCEKTAAVGAWNLHKGAGAVYVYVRSASGWHRQKSLLSPNGSAPDEYGWSVALSATSRVMRLLVGARNTRHHRGDVYSYTRSGTAWHNKADILNPGGAFPDAFGTGVALSGRTALIGAPGKANNAGAVYELTVP